MFLTACLIAWLSGLFLSGYLDSNILVFILASFCVLLGMGICSIASHIRKQKCSAYKPFVKLLILLVIATASSLLYQGYEQFHYEKAVSFCQKNPGTVTGVVTSEVSRYNDVDYCTLTLEDGENIFIKIKTEESLFPGEKVTLADPVLTVVHPQNKTSDQTRRLMGNDTFLSATFPYEPTVIRHGVANGWLYYSKLLRDSAKEHFQANYPPQVASFLTALLSSDKSTMTSDQYQEFINTGTVHIIVVSGMHFSFLASALLMIFGTVMQSRRKRLLLTLPLLFLFAWFTGGTISVLRSLLMISLLFCYDIFYVKPIKSYVTVLAVACLFATVTPTIILNPSFLLTFGATFGITAFYEPLERFFGKIPTGYLRSNLALYIAVQPFTLPVILLYFSRMPLGAILANFLVAPLVSPILILTILAMALANLPLLGGFIIGLGTLLSRLFLWLIHLSAMISHPLTLPLGKFPFLLWLGGGVLVFIRSKFQSKFKRIFSGFFATILLMTALIHTVLPIPNNELTVSFLGAKNTNSAIITTPADRLILYGTLQDIAYGRGSSYNEHASVALIILTELSDSEKTTAFLKELPSAQIVCPAKYGNLLEGFHNTVFLQENYATCVDGINIRLFSDSKMLYEAEFSYKAHQFSFSQNADYLLRNSYQNPDKIWIVNFKQSGSATRKFANLSGEIHILSKKEWHPDAKHYDNHSLLVFHQNEISFYTTSTNKKEQILLWN